MARRKTLTPMSKELRIPEGWVPPGPVPERSASRKPCLRRPRSACSARTEAPGPGRGRDQLRCAHRRARRVFLANADAASTLPLVFYVTGVLVAAGGLWSLEGHEWAPEAGYEQVEKEGWVSDAFVYFGIGLSIIAIGVAFELLL